MIATSPSISFNAPFSYGATAMVVTVDTPLLGARDRDRRSGGHTVDGMQPPNLAPISAPTSEGVADDGPLHQRVYNPHLDPSLNWDTLDWLLEHSHVPVLVKGVIRADDARRAVDHGAHGVIVSNHGARNLDTVAATATALPAIARTIDGQVPVLVDGGIRRGTDIAKALALGADAVLIGRPAIWGLAVGGAAWRGTRRRHPAQPSSSWRWPCSALRPLDDLTPDLVSQPAV